jgi:uncharacterized protein (DUF736 family)
MEATELIHKLKHPNYRKLAIWTVLVLMLVSSLAVVPDEVEAAGPGRKDITFYFHNVSTAAQVGTISTLRIMNTTMGNTLNTSVQSAKSVQNDFYLYPVLANETAIEGNVTVHLWARRTATSGDNRGANILFNMYHINNIGVQVATIASGTINPQMLTAWTEYRIPATNVAKYTVPKGHSIRVYVEVDGSSSNLYDMAWGDNNKKSRVDIEMHEFVRMNDIDSLDYQRTPRITFSQLATNKTIIFNANVTDPYGGYDVKWVNLSLQAPNGTTIINSVLMGKTKGFFNSFYNEFETTWNYTGFPTGQYNVTVKVVDNTGYYYRFPTNPGDATYGGHLESMTHTFWIGGMPHNATVTVVDNLDQALVGARVTLGPDAGFTDAAGVVVLHVANGTYDLNVYWQNTVVYSQSHSTSGDTAIPVKAAVYSPEIITLDDIGDPVEDAVVFTEHPNGTFLKAFWRTDVDGSIDWDLMAGGTYRLSILWMGVEVFNDTIDLTSEGPYRVTLKVYHLDVDIQDEVGDGIALAQVVITNSTTGIVADSKVTNLTGIAPTKLPIGSYDFVVYWRNVVVFDSLTDYLVDYSGTLVLRARIFAINLTVVDAMDLPLENARVVVGFSASNEVHDFGTTDANGELVTKIPQGYYDFWVYWKDILVNTTEDLWVDGSGDHTVHCAVFWVTLTVVDSRDAPVSNAIVTSIHEGGQDFGTIGTDGNGNVSYRFAGGDYDITVSWQEAVVYDAIVAISSNNPIVLRAAIFYLDLTVVDTMDVPVEGGLVTVTNVTTTRGMGAHSTDNAGNTTYRLPIGDYEISIVWQEANVFTGQRRLDVDIQEVIVAAIYYLNLQVVDSRAIPIEAALVTVTNDSTGRIMGSPNTDAMGNITLRMPMGEYNIRIMWQETVVHEDVRTLDSNEPVILMVAVYYMDIHVMDTLDVPLEGAIVTFWNSSTGRSMGSQGIGADGNASYRTPVGEYELEVVWVEAIVWQSHESMFSDRSIIIVAQVYYAFIQVVDTTDEPLANAQLTVTHPVTGRIMGSQTTDANGNATFRLPMDNYTINVVWAETVVYDAEREVASNEPLKLVASVYYAELNIVDSLEAALEAALVTFTNTTSGREMGEHTTGDDGIVIFRLPMGIYRLRVVWKEAVVYESHHTIDANDPWTIVTNVFYGELHIVDSQEVPLEAALVSLTNTSSGRPMGDTTTNYLGIVVYRLPMGVYTVQVIWIDTEVFNDFVTIDSNNPHTIVVNVYYPTFDVADSRDVAINGALVTMTKESNGRIIGSHLTDSAGSTTFRVPLDTYTVSVVWLDTLVHEAEYDVNSNAAFSVAANVFYVGTTARDTKGIGLEFAQISVTNTTTFRSMASHTADSGGVTEFRLPIGEYQVDVLWQNALVYDDTWTLTDDATWTLESWVYYVTFHVTDGDGIDLAGASISLANDTASTSLGPINTDGDGEAEFRLPLGDVSVGIVWKGVTVHEDDQLSVTADAVEEITAKVYYLTVKIFDSKNVRLKGATVSIEQEGVAVASDISNGRGMAEFRLPIGIYHTNISYTTTYALTSIHVEKSEEVDLSANYTSVFKFGKDDYPIPFYKTNLFWVVLVIVLLALLSVYLVYRGKQAAAVDEEEPIEYGDDDLDDLIDDLDENGTAAGVALSTAEGEDLEEVEVGEEDLRDTEEYSDDDLEEIEDADEADEVEDAEEADEFEDNGDVEEYSDDDLEDVEDAEDADVSEEPEEYTDEDLEEEKKD